MPILITSVKRRPVAPTMEPLRTPFGKIAQTGEHFGDRGGDVVAVRLERTSRNIAQMPHATPAAFP